ncbi:hypothetical protein HDU98_011868 [Podochytrium sp. JEL0797]|nr:hypothetical protein HDU98_011868 [Podochytrium sp. JEL0797]
MLVTASDVTALLGCLSQAIAPGFTSCGVLASGTNVTEIISSMACLCTSVATIKSTLQTCLAQISNPDPFISSAPEFLTHFINNACNPRLAACDFYLDNLLADASTSLPSMMAAIGNGMDANTAVTNFACANELAVNKVIYSCGQAPEANPITLASLGLCSVPVLTTTAIVVATTAPASTQEAGSAPTSVTAAPTDASVTATSMMAISKAVTPVMKSTASLTAADVYAKSASLTVAKFAGVLAGVLTVALV